MTLTHMRSEHIDGVKALLDVCFGEGAWSADTIRAQLEKSDSSCTVCLEGDTVVGYLAFEQIVDEGSIIELAVHPAHRRKGIARGMVSSALESADDLKEVFLEVRESNHPAVTLYEDMGFECIGVRKDYYDHPKEDGIIYRLALGVA